MDTYRAGSSIRISDEIKNSAGALFDPTTVKITIIVDGTTVVDAVEMTRESLGKYYYNWQSLAAHANKTCEYFINAEKGGAVASYERPGAFYLKLLVKGV